MCISFVGYGASYFFFIVKSLLEDGHSLEIGFFFAKLCTLNVKMCPSLYLKTCVFKKTVRNSKAGGQVLVCKG